MRLVESIPRTFREYSQDMYGRGTTATTLVTSSNSASKTVVLWANFFGAVDRGFPTPRVEQQVTLVHEFIHSRFNLTDPNHVDVLNKFGIEKGLGQTATDALDAWIKADCGKAN